MQSLIVANPIAGPMNQLLAAMAEQKCPAIRTQVLGLLDHAQKKEMPATHFDRVQEQKTTVDNLCKETKTPGPA